MTTKLSLSELLEKAKTEEIAIHTPAEEQAKALLKSLNKRGFIWFSGTKLATETFYETYEENTCYEFHLYKKVLYCSLNYYQNYGYTIIEFADIDFEKEKTKMSQREWRAWAHICDRALECMVNYTNYPGVKDKLNEDLKIIQGLLTRGENKMNQREWQAWVHIHHRASECMEDYDDYPRIKDRLNEDLKIIQDLLTNGEK